MIRNAEPGEKVVVLDYKGNPDTSGKKRHKTGDGPWETWDMSLNNTGIIMNVIRRGTGSVLWVEVQPFKPNTGVHTFRPKELRRLPADPEKADGWEGYTGTERTFKPTYVYCGVCGTGYSVGIVGPLCPGCQVPFDSVQGVME